MKTEVTVRDILNTKYLNKISRVVGGERGLDRTVSWVHILEIRDIVDFCVDGNEIVLTTGIGLVDVATGLDFFEKLLKKNISALCIETPLYLKKIPDELIEQANKHDLPLIEIFEISRFLDISKGLNKLILNKQSELYSKTDLYDENLAIIDGRGNIADGIRYTSEYLKIDLAYVPEKESVRLNTDIVAGAEEKVKQLKELLDEDGMYVAGAIAIKKISIFDETCGYLLISSKTHNLSDFDLLIINRLCSKIAFDISKKIKEREKKLYENNRWVHEWVMGELDEKEIKHNLHKCGFVKEYKNFAIINLTIDEKIVERGYGKDLFFDDFLLSTAVSVKPMFEEENIEIVGDVEKNSINYIALCCEPDKYVALENIKKAILKMKEVGEHRVINYAKAKFRVGRVVSSYTKLNSSYNSIMSYKGLDTDNNGILMYDMLHIQRILANLKISEMNEFAEDYLGELLKPENEELLNTLKVYYECNCSKQKTAERLYIVRQTLYARLQKLEEIVGKGYSEGDRKLAIEMAIAINSMIGK